jgi:hypothetical protein
MAVKSHMILPYSYQPCLLLLLLLLLLLQVVLRNAGHMVPHDQPEAAQEMIEGWVEKALAYTPQQQRGNSNTEVADAAAGMRAPKRAQSCCCCCCRGSPHQPGSLALHSKVSRKKQQQEELVQY